MPIEIERYTQERKGQWNNFLKTAKNKHFMFDRDYMDYHSDRFKDHSLIILNDRGGIIALFPANEADGILYSHQGLSFGGLITDKNMKTTLMIEIFGALKNYAITQSLKKIIYKCIPYFYHSQPANEDLYALYLNNARLCRVDVSSTIHLKDNYGFSDSRKNSFRKARKLSLLAEEGGIEDIEAFIKLINSTLEEKYDTHATHSAEELKLLMSRFPENIKLYKSVYKGEIAAAVLTFEMDNVIHLQYITSSPIGKETGALDIVILSLIEKSLTNKLYFDLGISTEKNGTYLNESLIFQKEGFGARATVHQFFEMDIA